MASLLRQVGRSLDKKISGLMVGLVCIYLASSISIPIAETVLLTRPQSNTTEDGLLVCQWLRNYIFVALAAGFIVLLWIVYAQLRRFIGVFIRSLERAMREEEDKTQKMQQQRQQPQEQAHQEQSRTTQRSAERAAGDTPVVVTPSEPRPHAITDATDWRGAAAATAAVVKVEHGQLTRKPHHQQQASHSHMSQLAAATAAAGEGATPLSPLPPSSTPRLPPPAAAGVGSYDSLSSRVDEFAMTGPSLSSRMTATRCETLRLSMWRYTRLTLFISVVVLLGIGVTVSGDPDVSTYAAPDPNTYRSGRAVVMAIQIVCMTLIWGVAKVPLQPLRDAYRKGRLWRTLRQGHRGNAAVEPLPFGVHVAVAAASAEDDDEEQAHQKQPHAPRVTVELVEPANPAPAATPMAAAAGPARGPPGLTPFVAGGAATAWGAGAAAIAWSAVGDGVPPPLQMTDTLLQPLDSAASKARSGLSMRSGRTSFRAVRRDGDAGLDAEEEYGAEDGVTHGGYAPFSGMRDDAYENGGVAVAAASALLSLPSQHQAPASAVGYSFLLMPIPAAALPTATAAVTAEDAVARANGGTMDATEQ
jgi:hypothetical protein